MKNEKNQHSSKQNYFDSSEKRKEKTSRKGQSQFVVLHLPVWIIEDNAVRLRSFHGNVWPSMFEMGQANAAMLCHFHHMFPTKFQKHVPYKNQ